MLRAEVSPALYDYRVIFTLLCRDSSSGMFSLWFPNKHKKSWSQASLRPRGIPTARGYNAPCFENVVHNFVGSVLMRWDNEDRKDKMRNALPEVFSLPFRKLSVGRLYLGCFLKMYGSKAPKRTRAFLTHACVFVILLCDTWLPHLFHPKTVAPRFLAFAEFCMLGGASHVEAPPHLRV